MTTPAKLFIGDLNFKTTEETIRNLFETVGTVNNVKIPKKNGKQLEYGFIEMADVESAKRALSQLDGHELNGRRIKVQIAKNQQMGINYKSSQLIASAPIQQQEQLHKIIKDIHPIIESNTINDEEKEMKIREIYNELKKKDEDELRKIFNIDGFKLIQQYINNCISGIEKILLDIIELVAEKGIQYKYIFFDEISSSGLLTKIEQIIKDKIEEEKEQMKCSNETEQLIRIQIQIMKDRKSNQQMIDSYDKVINKNINNLLNAINKLKDEDNKGSKFEQSKEETERQIKQSTQLIKVIPLIEERDPNSQHDLGTRIPELIILIMKERIFQIIHLNCPPEINCQQCINVPQSPTLIELKSATFQTLNDVSKYNQGFKGMLQKDLNFVLHLTHILIWFASQYQFIKETNSQEQNNQQLQESSSSLSLIASSLNLLSNLIRDNDNIRQTVIKTANFLYSLTTLTMCQLGIHFNQQYDLQAFTIRKSSRSCLCSIRSNGDASDHTELANAGYYNALIFAFSTAGGVGEEQDEEIGWNLDYIFKFLRSLNLGTHSLPHQLIPLLFKRIFEQVEEEGGNEEVDSQLINRGYGQSRNSMEYMASRTRGAILNFYIDLSTREPRWYY